MADGQLRLFVAVPLPPAAVDACATLIDEVRQGPAGSVARWVDISNLHLTVRFLGATPVTSLEAVREAVEVATRGVARFDVVLAGAGAFPNAERPRALWLGIADGAEALGALASASDAALAARGWASESRPYRPHLTVARVDAASRADGRAAAQALEAAAAEWRTAFVGEEVVLFSSHLAKGPPRYERLLTVHLG